MINKKKIAKGDVSLDVFVESARYIILEDGICGAALCKSCPLDYFKRGKVSCKAVERIAALKRFLAKYDKSGVDKKPEQKLMCIRPFKMIRISDSQREDVEAILVKNKCVFSSGSTYIMSDESPTGITRVDYIINGFSNFDPIDIKDCNIPELTYSRFMEKYSNPSCKILRAPFKMIGSSEQLVIVQRILLENGYTWKDGTTDVLSKMSNRYLSLIFDKNYEPKLSLGHDFHFADTKHPELTFEQFVKYCVSLC